MICRTPQQQYPVGENYSSINNSMRAEESCRDVRSTAEQGHVDARSHVPVKYQNQFDVTRIDNMRHLLVRRNLETRTRGKPKASHMRPWIYGSRLALSLVLFVSYSMRTADSSEVRPDYRRSSTRRNHMYAWYIRYRKKMPRSS